MNISGIRPYEGFYDHKSITSAPLYDTQSQQEDVRAEVVQAAPEQSYTSFDFAQNYRAGENYALKGLDSDIYSLDMQKAVSDLDKDQVLRQYQYFVGTSNEVTRLADPAEKILRSGENFSL